MLEPTTFDDPAEPPLAMNDRAMRVLESGIAFVALLSAIVLAVLPR
ncbi:MAG TPA: hypothetical protein VFK54_00165 [Candidatus Limnocylindrales bacterium]|nr:hypothetical protein [Candidatus Limnocylindrales bacterium]